MSGHTPGPWKWHPNVDCPGPQKGAFVFIEESGSRCFLADISARQPGTQAICEANARLIAAAPDLLEALKQIGGGRFDGASNLAFSGDWQGFTERLQIIAQDAIARAEPQEPDHG